MGRERGESRARGVGREKLCSHGVSGTLVRALEPAAGRPRLLAAAKLVWVELGGTSSKCLAEGDAHRRDGGATIQNPRKPTPRICTM